MNQIKVVHNSTVDMSLRYMLLNQMLSIQEAGYDVSGISAPVASSLVQLGASLGDIRTVRSPEEALQLSEAHN